TRIQVALLIFFLCWGIARALLIYFDYVLTQLNPLEVVNYLVFWKISCLFLMGAFGSIIFASEHAVFKGKDFYVFVIGYLVFFSIGIASFDVLVADTFMLFAMMFAGFIPLSYIYLAYKYPAARGNIALLFIGFAMFCVGVLMAFTTIVAMFLPMIHELYLMSAVIQIVGFSIYAIGNKRMYFAQKH
ncbi:MAG: hypothetical protein LUQ65_15065, partial [Candidatus Helarchaeota archaeon]|nr:hypothetical protein [Candidatus Helarchaeota archaeon]